jgi:hypothetical protein
MTQWRVLPLAVVFALVGVALAPPLAFKLISGAFALAGTAGALWQRRTRPELLVDASGYAVREHGREKLRVAWSEVTRVRADAAEMACYVDCGDPARNLLVPPAHGWGFRFDRSDLLYARILDAVPSEKIELVPRLDPR